MFTPIEDVAIISTVANSNSDSNFAVSARTSATTQQTESDQKSWGDKYKQKALRDTRNIGINYFLNAGIAIALTYGVIKSPANKWLQKGVNAVTNGAVALGAHQELGKFLGEFLVRTQLLLVGGHVLIPPLKYIHDHKRKLEFETGHKLDLLQKFLGRGNAATKRNIAEYKYVKDLLNAKPQELSNDDKALLGKHYIGDNFQFNEKPESWKHVLFARGLGVASTTALSGVLAAGSYYGGKDKLNKPWMDVKQKYLKEFGGGFGEKYLAGPLKRIRIKDPGLVGELIVLEAIYTAASKLGFDHMERRLLKKQEKADAEAAAAALAQDRQAVLQSERAPMETEAEPLRSHSARVTSSLDARRAIIDAGEKGFRARESAKPAETGIAVS